MVTLPVATSSHQRLLKEKAKSSWIDAKAGATTSLEKLARFQQRQLQEKEQKLLQLYDQQRQRAHQVAQRGSGGANNNAVAGNNNHQPTPKARTSSTKRSTPGIDKSYPLEPLNAAPRRPPLRAKHDVNRNTESIRVNGHYEINIDDVIDDEAMQRNRMLAKFQPADKRTPGGSRKQTPRESTVMKLTKSSSLKVRQKSTYLARKSKEKLKKREGNARRCCKRAERRISDDYDPLKSTSLVSEVINNRCKHEKEDPCRGDSEKLGKVKTIVMKIENITSGLKASAKILFKLKRSAEEEEEEEEKAKIEEPKQEVEEEKKEAKKIEDQPPRRPSADELRRESFELKRQMFEQILAENRRRDSVESALKYFDSISIEELPPDEEEEEDDEEDRKSPTERGFERSTTSWKMRVAKEEPTAEGRRVKKSQSLRIIGSCSAGSNEDRSSFLRSASPPPRKGRISPSPPPAAVPEPKSRQKSSSMKFLSRIVGSNGDLEFTTENGYSSAPRKSSMPSDLEQQKTGPPVTPAPRTTVTAPGAGTNRPAGNRTAAASKPRPAGAKTSSGADSSATDNSNLQTCKVCNRRFTAERITLHEQICAKTAQKKRKQFDVVTHRVKGTELESFVTKPLNQKKSSNNKSNSSKPESEPSVQKSNWRRKHEDFINAIRSAKEMQAFLASGGKLSDLPPPPPSDTSDYVQCPHCSRKFNKGAAERHIPRCETMHHNKPKVATRVKR